MHLKNLRNRVHNSNIRNELSLKLSRVFTIVLLILIIVSMISVFVIIRRERRSYAEREAENVLISLSTSLRSDIDSYRNISRLLMTDESVKEFLKAKPTDVTLQLTESARLGMLDILNVTSGVDAVYIFRNDSQYATTMSRNEYRLDSDRIKQVEWRSGILKNKGRASLSLNGNGATYRRDGRTVLTINRAVYDNVSQKQTGVMFMNLSLNFIENEINLLKNDDICVMTTDGVFLTGNRHLEQYYSAYFANEKIQNVDVTEPGGDMILSGVKLKKLPIVILYAIKDERYILPLELLYVIILLPLVYFICIFVAGIFIKKNITNPIFSLTSEMEKNRHSESIEKINLELPNNEIGMLKDSYNKMVDHSNDLMDRLLEKEQLIQKAEMRVLHEQIKPHFLYNSLETIGFLALDSGAENVHSALETLGSFYRNFLSKGDREIPLKREIMIIQDYLSLQKLRYGDILNDEYDIAEDTNDCYIPKLILQPLVENSIYHGIRMKGEPGTIKISSFIKFNELHILVRDTGIGMSKEQIDSVLSTEKKESETGVNESFGLWGTIERIRCFCDKEDIVRINSELGEYTEIEFIMPNKRQG